MIRVDLIGPGDIDFHYQEILGISKTRLEGELAKIAKALKLSGIEIALLPDRGVSIEIARRFKQLGGELSVWFHNKIKHLELNI